MISVVPKKFPFHDGMVDLNGGWQRMTGRRFCNRRLRYRNGFVGRPYDLLEAVDAVPEMCDLNAVLSRRRIPFLFVLSPCKIDLQGRLFPAGWTGTNPNVVAREQAESLKRNGVDVLDLVPVFAGTPEAVAEHFFRTDHHWRPLTALLAAQRIADRLSDILKRPALRNAENLRLDRWRWCTVPDGFLGSHGRRTGVFFSGRDTFAYALPRFKTSLRVEIPGKRQVREGDFGETEIVSKYLKPETGRTLNRYAAYTGPEVGVMIHRNAQAPVPSTVMLLKDSFGNPVAAYLATVFRTVVQVDPRRLPEGTAIPEVVDRYHPDAVVKLVNPSTFLSSEIRYEELR